MGELIIILFTQLVLTIFLKIRLSKGEKNREILTTLSFFQFLLVSFSLLLLDTIALFVFGGETIIDSVPIVLLFQGHVVIASVSSVLFPVDVWNNRTRTFKMLLWMMPVLVVIVYSLHWLGIDLYPYRALLYLCVVIWSVTIMFWDIVRGRDLPTCLNLVSQPTTFYAFLSTISIHVIYALGYMLNPLSDVNRVIIALLFLTLLVYLFVSYIKVGKSYGYMTYVQGYGYKNTLKEEHVVQEELIAPEQRELIDKLKHIFDMKKPYLNPTLSIGEVALMLCTNRSYLSKLINTYLGVNFNEFVNKYRVEHAKKIFKKDPSMDMKILYQQSGFRNQSSFNSAFKQFSGMTPGDWCRRVKKGGI